MKNAPIAALGLAAAAICCIGHVIVLALLGGAGLSALAGWANGAVLILLAAAAVTIVFLHARSSLRSHKHPQVRKGD